MDLKIDTFCQIDIRDLAILGVEKVVFWIFSKFFKGCLGSVWASFLDLKGLLTLLWGPAALKKVDKASPHFLFPKGRNLTEGSHWFECSLSLNLLILNFYPPTTQTFRCLIPQRRGSLKNLTEGSLLFECSLSFILLISKFDPPTTQTFRRLIPQRRGSLKNLTEGSHLFECSLSFILLISKFDPPTTQTFRRLSP